MICNKKVIISIALGFLLLTLIVCGKKGTVSPFENLTTGNIKKVEVSYSKSHWTRSLTDDEIAAMVRLLNNTNKNDIKEYNGPAIKGGPALITISMKSDKTLDLILNEDSFIYNKGGKDYQVHQPAFSKFINQFYHKN